MKTSGDHLTADDVTQLMRSKLLPSYARDLEGVIQFGFMDEPSFGFRLIASGETFELRRGQHAQPHLQITLAATDYLAVLSGNVTQLYASGRLKLEGNLGLGLGLARMLSSQASVDWFPDRQRIEEISARGAPLERIERREMPPREVFQREYAQVCRPVILVDVVKTWDVGALSPEQLKARFDSLRVVPRVGDYVAAAFTPHHTYAQLSLAEYLDMSQAPLTGDGPPPYLGNNAVPDGLLGSLQYPPFFVPETCGRPTLWLGPAGTITPLHRDLVDNALAQVFGSKRLLLFPPEQSRFLYTWSNSKLLDGAKVDPDNPDPRQYPLFEQARGLECTLEPGELLFIPAGWFHKVRTLALSLSISFFKLYEPPASSSA